MALVDGRPFLELLLAAMARGGVDRVLLSVGYRYRQIQEHFGLHFAGMRLDYEVEDTPLGTGGALKKALDRLGPGNDPIFALNGDTFVDVDYTKVWGGHLAAAPRPALTVVVREVTDPGRYGCVELEGDRVVDFRTRGGPGAALVNAGVYLLERDLFAGAVWPEAFSFEREVLEARVQCLRFRAHVTRGHFVDIGVPEGYAAARALLAAPSPGG